MSEFKCVESIETPWIQTRHDCNSVVIVKVIVRIRVRGKVRS